MEQDNDRREFLAKCGRFAVIVPPAMTTLLSTSLTSDAIAHSGGATSEVGGRGNNGFGNLGNDGSNAGKQDITR